MNHASSISSSASSTPANPVSMFNPQVHLSGTSPSNDPHKQNVQPRNSSIEPEILDKPLSENPLTLRHLMSILNEVNRPINDTLNLISRDLTVKMTDMDTRIECRESENAKKEVDNAIVKQTIINMQKSLNRIDNEERNKNVIIVGLQEDKIEIDNNDELASDVEKIKWILNCTGNQHFTNEDIDNLNVTRLGTKRIGYNRVIKILLPSIAERDNFLKDSHKLNDADDIWSKVCITKDQHPVYIAVNNRLRKK